MQDLLPQPDEADEGQQGEAHHGAALQDVRQDVLRAEHVDGQGEDGGDRPREESPVDPAGGERDHPQPGNGHQRVVEPELDSPDISLLVTKYLLMMQGLTWPQCSTVQT